MEKYQKPTAEIIRFRQSDVISASGCDSDATECPNDWEHCTSYTVPCILTPIIWCTGDET
jgi:hypothetical protein